jgi:glycosyltransferase involved in cell wall biosynthesis
VAFVGRLVPYKGADLLIEATAAFMRSGTLNLHIVGDGPQRDALRNKACNLNVDKNIRFYGQIPHERVQDILVECDCLALPSVREFGGGVVLEAMALGAPPIVADYAGPSELVDESCGVRVPFSNADSLVQGMREAIGQFIQMPERLVPLGGAARERALKAFTWDAKAKEIVKVYDAIASPPPSPAERPPAARSTD